MADDGFKVCPFCKEKIRKEAVKCRFCGEWLEESHPHGPTVPDKKAALGAQSGSLANQNPNISSSDGIHQKTASVSKTEIRETSRNKKLLILAAVSTCAMLLLDLTNLVPLMRPPQVHILTYLGEVVGGMFVLFTCGAPFAAWIKGRTGLVIGLITIIIVCGLEILGNSMDNAIHNSSPVSNNDSGKDYKVTDPKTGNTLNDTKLLAERGDAKAQYDMGNYYDTGQGVARNAVEAVKWYRKSAEQNYAPAECSLWICYHTGYGVAEDKLEAMKWLRKAAEQDDADAECFLGMCYKEGEEVAKNDAEAVKWLRKSAERDLSGTTALYELGNCYLNGQGVLKDYVEAYKWFDLASAHGNADAKRILPTFVSLMTTEQIAEGQRLAREFELRKK